MASGGDFAYLQRLLRDHHVQGPVLEVGSYAWQGDDGNARRTVEAAGLAWTGADVTAGPGVDFTLDILDDDAVGSLTDRWGAVLLFNLLEHVYDPARALRNALSLVAPGGCVVVCGPAVWQLHDFPADYWRPLPDFYVEFARRHQAEIVRGTFTWVLDEARMYDVDALRRDDQKLLPSNAVGDAVFGRRRWFLSRAAHKLLNTAGRQLAFPYSSLGVVIRRAS